VTPISSIIISNGNIPFPLDNLLATKSFMKIIKDYFSIGF